jgi:AcrR family transcriptional regulator
MMARTRHTAEERREEVLEAAMKAFARGGLDGTSTEEIARAAGISQPYLFRLFGTKKELFIASLERCLEETRELFRAAAAGQHGEEALHAMGMAYVDMVVTQRDRLLLQMQGYAACHDPDVREAMRHGYGQLVLVVEAISGLPAEAVSHWFAQGKLLNVVVAMDLWNSREAWAQRLIDGCIGEEAHKQAFAARAG